jgi:DNA-directed RNA polymerase alpha subunit
MDISRVSNWVDFVVSELTHNELEYFEKMLQQIIQEKNRIFLEEPLTANPKKFKGIKIEDAELTLRSTRILISRKYKTLDQVAKLSRNKLIALSKYGFMRKSMTEITDLLADDKTQVSKELYDSLKLSTDYNELQKLVGS